MSRNPYVPSANVSTWNTINDRLRNFDPSIELADYIDFTTTKPVQVMEYASEGINFKVANDQSGRGDLLQALRAAQTHRGKPGFLEGRWEGALHAAKGAARDLMSSVTGKEDKASWANNVSFLATKGIGFRQIWYVDLPERQLRLKSVRPPDSDALKLDPKFSAMFRARNDALDLSSLHLAIGDPDPNLGYAQCNVHIDQVGIIAELGGVASLTPDTPYHTLVELAYRTGLKGILPDLMLQRLDFIMPSSSENYALNFGFQANLIKRKNLRFSVRGLCSIDGPCRERSVTFNLWGTHRFLEGK